MTQRTGIACGDDVVTPVAAHSAGIDRFSGTTYALAQAAAGCSRVLNLKDLIVSVTVHFLLTPGAARPGAFSVYDASLACDRGPTRGRRGPRGDFARCRCSCVTVARVDSTLKSATILTKSL